jgi:hypothetical protein
VVRFTTTDVMQKSPGHGELPIQGEADVLNSFGDVFGDQSYGF